MLEKLHPSVKVLLLSSLFLSLSFGLAYPYLSEYIYSISGSASVVGLIISIRNIVCILALILGGHLGDELGRRRTIGIGTISLGASQLIYASAINVPTLFIAAICEGISTFHYPSFNALIMDATAQDQLTSIFTLSFIIERLPYTITPILGGFLRDIYGIQGLRLGFALTGATSIVVGFIRVRLLEETIRSAERTSLGTLWRAYKSLPESFLSMRAVVQRLVLLRLFCLIAATSMFYYFAVLYATRYTQMLSFTEWGLITAIASAPLPLTLPLSRVIGRRSAPAYALLIAAEALAIMLFMIPEKLIFVASLIPLNTCSALIYAIERSTIARETEKSMRARAETLMIISFYLGDALGSYAGSIIYAQNPLNIFPIASTLLMVGSILGFIILKQGT